MNKKNFSFEKFFGFGRISADLLAAIRYNENA